MCTRKILGVISCLTVLSMLAACGKDKSTQPNADPFWTVRLTDEAYEFSGVCWGDAGFVVVGQTEQATSKTSVNLNSPDGVQWSAPTVYPLAIDEYMVHVTWAGTNYVAISHPLGLLSVSADGIEFTKLTAYPRSAAKFAWSGDFLAVIGYGVGGWGIDTSANGTAWGQITATMPWSSPSYLCYGGGQWVLTDADTPQRVWRSTDLRTWTAQLQLTVPTAFAHNIAWSGSEFLLVSGNQAYRSPTGEAWTSATLQGNEGKEARYVAWAGTEWVVAGDETYRSADGVTWSKVSDSASYSIRDLAWNGHILVGVDLSGRIVTATP